MIQRDLLGIPVPESLLQQDSDVYTWWHNYKRHQPVDIDGELLPEKTLIGSLKGHLIVATYDLIAITDDKNYVIFDWKTWKTPRSAQWMQTKLQAKVYPWLLAQAGEALNNNTKILPENIEMRYWFASIPEQSFAFQYSQSQFEKDTAGLSLMIDRILELEDGRFELTEDLNKCKYCPYRSYCGRGKNAGRAEEAEDEPVRSPANLLGTLDDYESIAF